MFKKSRYLYFIKIFVLIIAFSFVLNSNFYAAQTNSKAVTNEQNSKVQFWLSSPANNILFQKQNLVDFSNKETNLANKLVIDESVTYQEIDGFGYTLTGGSAMLINKMSKRARKDLLNELFGTTGSGIGVSYLRISIGASDLSENVFSYNDLPEGETDFELKKFSISAEKADLIPVLKEILEINPDIKIMGSPWSAPLWMKTNNKSIGGSLKYECFDVYARFFVEYIKAMGNEGIVVDAITIQNEPLHPGNNPSMYMTAGDQGKFIKENLGPEFERAGIKTKIILYDHNADRVDYPMSILSDPETAKYVDGSAFHLYGGKIEALSELNEKFPDKNLYFTEQWVGAPGNMAGDLSWHIRSLIIGATRNWCRNVLEWNLAADKNNDPHTVGGCDRCLGAVTIDSDSVTRNPAYYIIAHASKFVQPGSVRISSNYNEILPNVAFKTPEGKIALIVLNDSKSEQIFEICHNNKFFDTKLFPGAVGTFVW